MDVLMWRPAILILLVASLCQGANPELLKNAWAASWAYPAGADPFGYGVYHYRKTLDLPSRPAAFLIHVSADNRYQLFVNGERVAWGPARGDLFHWRYESIDIAPHLRAGKNVLAAVVWNDGEHRGVAQISHRTALLVQGDTEAEHAANTPEGWVSAANPAYSPLPITMAMVRGYVAIPPGEHVDAALYPWGWEQPDFDDSKWQEAVRGSRAAPRNTVDSPSRWFLVPREIPLMEESPIRLARVRLADGMHVTTGFLAGKTSLRFPANRRTQLLLDQNHLTTGYPELILSGGKGAKVTLRYAEALWQSRNNKGNRDEIEGKEFVGFGDAFTSDGGTKRLWRPLFWRTWRYLELTVETQEEPLNIDDIRGVYTGYPFERKARFQGGPDELQKMLDVGWRTARLCAHESYMDCPYYEQLQYVGDARIQAMVSVYMSGDARLVKNAIGQVDASRTSEGATYSRAPSAQQQYIPPFSLWWIGMVHDYWRYVDDPDFVKQMLPGTRSVLAFFHRYQRSGGSLEEMPWWNYVDWVAKWPRGMPPRGEDGSTAPIDLQLLLAYQYAADLEDAMGMGEMADVYRARASELSRTIRAKYWAPDKGLFSDDVEHRHFSQHANTLATLAGVVEGSEAKAVMELTVAGQDLAPASIYFRYYLHRALVKAGAGDRYLEMLGPWRTMLADGLTTWAERDHRSRSDCHAWGASPNVELFRTVLGIDSAAPGFAKVAVAPHLGALQKVSGTMPHPRGEISVALEVDDGKLHAEISLPPGVNGEFVWQGQSKQLTPGGNRLDLRK
jgi:alpha-L-rhamnosidase